MPPNLNYYKSSNPLHNTRKNNTARPILTRNRGKRNLLRINNGATRKNSIIFSSNIGAQNNVRYIKPRNKGFISSLVTPFNPKGANVHLKEYHKRRGKMTQEERNAENEEERNINAELAAQAHTAKNISNYRKRVLRKLNGKKIPNNN